MQNHQYKIAYTVLSILLVTATIYADKTQALQAGKSSLYSYVLSFLKYHLDNGLKKEIAIGNDSEIGIETDSMYTENEIEDRTITCILTKLFYQKTKQFIQYLEFYTQMHTLDVAVFFLLVAQSIHLIVSVTKFIERRIKGITLHNVENTPPMTMTRLVTPTIETMSKENQIKSGTSYSFEAHPNEHTKISTSNYSKLQENHLELECQRIKEMIEEKLINYKKSSFSRNPTLQVKEFDCENSLLATDKIYATIFDLKKLARTYDFEALEPVLYASEIPQRPHLQTVSPRFETRNLEDPKILAPPPGFEARIPEASKFVVSPPGFGVQNAEDFRVVAPPPGFGV